MSKFLEQVKEIVAEELDLEISEINADSTLVEDLGADSLDVVELVMSIEDRFDLEIPDEDAEKISTVQDIVSYIEAQ